MAHDAATPSALAVGVLLPTRELHIQGSPDLRGVLDLAVAAEEAGFDSVWAGDSLTARPRAEPLTVLAAVAGVTDRVVLGTAALTAALRHPLFAAHTIATLDQLSEGRLCLALGSGFPLPETEEEFGLAGVPFEGRAARLVDVAKTWKWLWSSESREPAPPAASALPDAVRSLPMPVRDGGPPLWLAGAGPRALRRVGEVFDGWLPYPPSTAAYREGWEAIAAAATATGRDPADVTPALYLTVNCLSESTPAARRGLDAYCQAYYGLPLDLMEAVQGFFAGSSDECAEWVERYVAAGARHLVLRFGSPADHDKHLAWAATELLPHLRRSAAREAG